ncbi:MAG: phosphoadenosine phosphosulfate reductase family protein [Methylobacterium sp.]|uniref:phosphoadenosine phosphosulfate reductase domain-containing protein n=1 Tax=Methylobacterium sp. TaxID=409 RepID=UPI0025FBEC99|nr:phosphoadenosine phosphosulfate reductase family protein [Methylobacterium sp.]MBX9934427.1 phosphoadenosine phosphosulfate reductase family protein [Methylobacterium sp.]
MSALSIRQADLFAAGAERLVYDDAVELTLMSLAEHGPKHDHWAVAWSGGKDSTATLTLIVHLIEAGRLAPPKTLTVYYADTRQELTPLAIAAADVMARLARFPWIRLRVVTAPLDRRFLVYILGRGVPPPNNNTLRWCTRQIKIDPMAAAIEADLAGLPETETVLTITGVRQGESAIRDRRIEMSCSRDGAECGQGWYQQVLPGMKGVRGRLATLAPILHWRVCNVWDWLKVFAPMARYGGWATAMLADAYGGDEAEEVNARTGCIGCPLASEDKALNAVIALPAWSHLTPLLGLRPIYRRLRLARNRLRQPGGEKRKDGTLVRNQQRMGPITLPARLAALDDILAIQAACNDAADRLGRPRVDILNAEEEGRIRELIAAGTWPQRWSGDEPVADVPLDAVFSDGTVQPLLIGAA